MSGFVPIALMVLGAGALYLAVANLRTATQGYVRWTSTVRWAEQPRLFVTHVLLSILLLFAGIFAVARAAMGLG